VPLLSWISSPISKTTHEDRVSYEGVGVGDSNWAFLDGNPLGAVVIYMGQGLGFSGWYGVLLKV
jgi:hypothetical protein